ncbi:MAG: hypothetical protein JW889_15115 [Verrucomicrobia bacterium]|nr:hypothetical protein [Verrucomicrobiota bacterium]
MLFLLVVGVAGGGYYYCHRQRSCSFLTQRKIKVGERSFDVWSKEAIEKRGLPFRMVPDRDNAAVLYVKAARARTNPTGTVEDGIGYSASWAWDPNDGALMRWLDDQKECLSLLHRATRKPDCQFPILGDDKATVLEIQIPQLAMMRTLTRLLVCEGKRCEYGGDCEKALSCYLEALDLAEHLDMSDDMLICKLVVVACNSIGTKAVEMAIANGRLSQENLKKVISRFLRAASERPQLAEVLSMERVLVEDTVHILTGDPGRADEVASAIAQEQAPELARRLGTAARAGSQQHMSEVARIWDWATKWAEIPPWQALQPSLGWRAYIDRYPPRSELVKLLLANFGQARDQFARSEAQLGGVALFAAIKLYEKKNGRPPASLSELEGGCISRLPKDPFSGRDYIYKVRGNDWILYSVYENLIDDGGAGSWPHKMSEDKDLIWRNTPIPVKPRGR